MFDFIEDQEVREKAESVVKSQLDEVKSGVDEQVRKAVDEATKSLKANHDRLLDEKKKLQKRFEGIDNPEEALEALKFLNESDEARAVREGKFQELLETKVSEATSDLESKLSDTYSKLKETQDVATTYKQRFEKKIIEDTLREAAIAAKIRPEAIPDLILHGSSIFSVSDTGEIEARDSKGKLMKTEDKIMNPTLFIEGRKKTSPHWWPESESAGLYSGEDSDSLDAQMADAAKKGQTERYRRLKAKKNKLA